MIKFAAGKFFKYRNFQRLKCVGKSDKIGHFLMQKVEQVGQSVKVGRSLKSGRPIPHDISVSRAWMYNDAMSPLL